MTQPATVASGITAPLGELTASTLYLMAMQTDGSTRKVVCIQFAPGTMIQNDSAGALQFISTGVVSGSIPISAMNMTGDTSQYVRGDGSLHAMPTIPSAQVSSDWNSNSGLAQILNKPSLGTQMSVDSGWAANNTVGDKTAALSSYSNGINGTMVTALNAVSLGTGTALSAALDVIVVLVKQVAAMRTALIAAKLPNV